MKKLDEPREDIVPFQEQSLTARTKPADDLRAQWTAIQSSFVDEPRQAVESADRLVASAIKQIEEVFFAERANLEKQWSRGEEVSTENLRVSLQHYREFFERLMAVSRV